MKNRIFIYSTLLAACVLSLMACAKRDLNKYIPQGYLQIDLDWGSYIPPAETGYFFFREGEAGPIYLSGTAAGFYGKIPAGNYKVLMHNPSMQQAGVNRSPSYQTTTFSADTDTRGAGYICSVKEVYGMFLVDVVVPEGETPAVYVSAPVKYEKDVEVIVHPNGLSGIASIDIEVCGIVHTVHVHDGSAADLNTSKIMIPTVLNQGSGSYEGEFSIFDVYGTSEIRGVVALDDGDMLQSLPEDVSPQLQNIPNTGTTINTQLTFPNGGSLDITVSVKPWQAGASGGGEVG